LHGGWPQILIEHYWAYLYTWGTDRPTHWRRRNSLEIQKYILISFWPMLWKITEQSNWMTYKSGKAIKTRPKLAKKETLTIIS